MTNMNILGLVFAGIVMFILIFFGLGATQSLHDGANITASDVMYDDYQTATEVSTQVFGFMGFIPYLIFVVALFSVLLLLLTLVR